MRVAWGRVPADGVLLSDRRPCRGGRLSGSPHVLVGRRRPAWRWECRHEPRIWVRAGAVGCGRGWLGTCADRWCFAQRQKTMSGREAVMSPSKTRAGDRRRSGAACTARDVLTPTKREENGCPVTEPLPSDEFEIRLDRWCMLVVADVVKSFGDVRRARRAQPVGAAWRDRGVPGSQRCRQEHHDAGDHGSDRDRLPAR